MGRSSMANMYTTKTQTRWGASSRPYESRLPEPDIPAVAGFKATCEGAYCTAAGNGFVVRSRPGAQDYGVGETPAAAWQAAYDRLLRSGHAS
jgi:hypothetical protein